MRHFTSILDLDQQTARHIIARGLEMKKTAWRGETLRGKHVAMIFEKASTRTRVSFEVGIRQLGGNVVFMTPVESQLGRSEPLRDTARVLSRYCDGLVVRTFGQDKLDELIRHGSIHVINALTDQGHPCQVMSDVLTMYELNPDFAALQTRRVAWIGDGNNMANSWIEAAMTFGFSLTLACPEGYDPSKALLEQAARVGAPVRLVREPQAAARDADFINTDVWTSMGQEAEQKKREQAFKGFIVDDSLMRLAAPGARFMHCLPAHRGEEVSAEVMEGPASIVFDQAENRLHCQKAVMEWVFTG